MWYFSHKHKLAYLNIPKSGCTSIHFLLLACEQPELVRDALNNSDNASRTAWQLQYDHRKLLDPSGPYPKTCRDYKRFTFVRHPTKRIISGYLNKILMWKDDTGKVHQHDPNLFEKRYAPGGFYPQMPLDEFVNCLQSASPRIVNGHFKPQTQFVYQGPRARVDFVGKIENFSSDLKTLIPPDIHDLINIKLNATPKPPTLSITQKTRDHLIKYTQSDGKKFDYDVTEMPSYLCIQ